VGLEVHSDVVSESFPAAIRIGNELLALGDEMGHELIVKCGVRLRRGDDWGLQRYLQWLP
jgi:hypothetical protein